MVAIWSNKVISKNFNDDKSPEECSKLDVSVILSSFCEMKLRYGLFLSVSDASSERPSF